MSRSRTVLANATIAGAVAAGIAALVLALPAVRWSASTPAAVVRPPIGGPMPAPSAGPMAAVAGAAALTGAGAISGAG